MVLHVHNTILVAVLATLLALSVLRDFVAINWMSLLDGSLLAAWLGTEERTASPVIATTGDAFVASPAAEHDMSSGDAQEVGDEALSTPSMSWSKMLESTWFGICGAAASTWKITYAWVAASFDPQLQRTVAQFIVVSLACAAFAIAIFGPYVVARASAPNAETQRQLRMRPEANALRQLIHDADLHARRTEGRDVRRRSNARGELKGSSDETSDSPSEGSPRTQETAKQRHYIREVFCVAAEAELISHAELELIVGVRGISRPQGA